MRTSTTFHVPQLRLWRSRLFWAHLFVGSLLFSLISVVLVGGTRLSQYEREIVAATAELAATRSSCAHARTGALGVDVPSAEILVRRSGPTWWLADRLGDVLGAHGLKQLEANYRRARARSQCDGMDATRLSTEGSAHGE